MSKYREKYLEVLSNAVCEILKKEEFTETDINILLLYNRELVKCEHIPVLKKLVKFTKEASKMFNKGDDEVNG